MNSDIQNAVDGFEIDREQIKQCKECSVETLTS